MSFAAPAPGRPPEFFLEPKDVARLKRKVLRDHDKNDQAGFIRYAFASFTGEPSEVIRHATKSLAMRHIPIPLWTALTGVMVCHDRLLRHYQWGHWVAGEKNKPWPWKWPKVPGVAPR
jgi:hypothetical protein